MKSSLPPKNRPKKLVKSANLFPVVGIGASAGGLDAFKKLLKAIPVDSGMAYVLVQHLAPNHESSLPEILQKVTSIPVLAISDDIKVEPNHIYVIPSNKMMVATDGVLLLAPRPAKSKNERNLPIDLFFTSLAEVHQSHAIGVVLSGTATDGTLGLKAIKDHGGITFAQDEASAEYEGMPHSAVQAGVVDFILPPDKIPGKLLEVTKIINTAAYIGLNLPLEDDEVFKQIISVLRIRKGTDFTYYKQTTIRRRILRRMAINKNEEPAAYLKYLRENKQEQDVLYQDLLIPVTSFFRDHKSFENLCENVFPLIIKNKAANETIRVWVAGCSTGEEAYSMAICFKEFLGMRSATGPEERVQIFATDLSEPAIAKARTGIYSKIELAGITAQRLAEFFTKTNGSYQVNRQLRDICVFANHNFLKDPPFGKMDLISCRNVLIYMEPYLQKKALTTFHYALNPKGFLLLGKSETTAGVPDLFASAAKNEKLFARKDVPSRFIHVFSQRAELNLSQNKDKPKAENMRSDFQKTADDIVLSRYTPAGVVVNEAMDIVQFRGSTSNYLEQASGKPSHNLLSMAKHGLAFELRSILHKSKKEKAPVIKENIPVQINGRLSNVSIEVIPLPGTIDPHFLILFHDGQSIGNKQLPVAIKKATAKSKTDDKDLRILQLEQELAQTREDMRTITEDQEAANEELQSANEELLSGSEELQSLNEELETSKEELQSTNEELTVVNHEMISLNEQVAAARNYAESIVANIREPLLVLDKNLRIKTANKSFYTSFRVNEQETEGSLIYDLGNKQWDIPELRTLLEKILPEKSIFNDFEVTHSFPVIGELIMLLNAREVINKDNSEKLILLSIEDVTERETARRKMQESEHRYHNMIYSSPSMIGIFKGEDMIVEIANDAILNSWDKGKDIIGKSIFSVLPEIVVQGFDKILLNVYKTGTSFHSYEMPVTLVRRGKEELIYYSFIYQPQRNVKGEIEGVAVIASEVTPQAILHKKIKESEETFRQLAELMPQKISNADAAGNVFFYNQNWINYTGLTIESLKDNGWSKVMHPDELEEIYKRWQHSIQTGNNFEMEIRLLNKEGEYKWHLSRASSVKDEKGEIIKWLGASTEIQEQVTQRETLENAVKERTNELSEANGLLAGKNEELQKMNKELESFAYVTSHDLQEPLRKIQIFASRILEKDNERLSDDGKNYFRIVRDSANRMQTLIDDLLTFSGLTTAERKFEINDLNDIIEKIKIELKETIEDKHATIEATELCPANIIAFQFHQLMQNLISNALKFSNPTHPPHIIIKSRIIEGNKLTDPRLSPEKKYCHISVTDNGIGFEKKFSEKIFEVFQRLHGKEEYAGTGIGLAIVRKIVDNHHGIISATSKLNKGTTFDIYIPAAG
jgi:two-component system CheB/CheR fusion protein